MLLGVDLMNQICLRNETFDPLTIQQRQPQTQCGAARQKPLQMGSGQMLSSDWASFAEEENDVDKPRIFFIFGQFCWNPKMRGLFYMSSLTFV